MTEPVQQITANNFIRLGIAAFKEHELREIVATFCKLPGIAPQPASVAQEVPDPWANAIDPDARTPGDDLGPHELIRIELRQAMLDCWNSISADTDCHPLDIKHQGKKLFFTPDHWADMVAWELSCRLSHHLSMRDLILSGGLPEASRGALTKLAAECHRAKWQFGLSEDYTPSRAVGRAMILKASDELHRIGDLALKLRDAPPLSPAERGSL